MDKKNLKALLEKRSALIAELDGMVKGLENDKGEVRAFTADEVQAYGEKKTEVEALTASIRAIQETRAEDITVPAEGQENAEDEEKRAAEQEKNELRMFEDYLRHNTPMQVETRSDVNWTTTANGAVLPTTIANKIVEKVVEISPVFALATKYNVGGTLNIPYYDESTSSVTCAYATEFDELEASAGQFKSIQLTGFLAGALSKISRQLINNSNFPIVDYVIGKIAEAAAKWIDKENIIGTPGKITGLSGATQIITAASTSVITTDELVDVQDTVPDVYQADSVWIMSKAARSAIRKLKDGDGNYLLNKDATTKWGYTLFGKPVYITDAIPGIKAGEAAIYYGDFSGLAVKISEGFSLQLLLEKYATQHAIGAVAWFEMDAKIENQQKIAVLKMAN